MNSLTKDIEAIIAAGIQAPSGDNLQPWRFVISGNKIAIFGILEKDYENKLLVTNEFALYSAHGALIENLVIAASHFKYKADVVLFPDPSDHLHTADIVLTPGEGGGKRESVLYSTIVQRSTDRNPYASSPIPLAAKEALQRIPSELGIDARVLFAEGERLIRKVASGVVAQVVLLFSHKLLHDEFYHTIRWNRKAVDESRDGLDILTLELSFFNWFMFKYILRPWFFVKTLSLVGIQYIAAEIESLLLYRHAGAYCAIVLPNETREDYIKAGRILERVWLSATQYGLSIQPTQAIILLKKTLDVRPEQYTASHSRLIVAKRKMIDEAFDLKGEHILYLFRIGFGKRNHHTSLRKEPEIIFES
jgi:hypothetical protein